MFAGRIVTTKPGYQYAFADMLGKPRTYLLSSTLPDIARRSYTTTNAISHWNSDQAEITNAGIPRRGGAQLPVIYLLIKDVSKKAKGMLDQHLAAMDVLFITGR